MDNVGAGRQNHSLRSLILAPSPATAHTQTLAAIPVGEFLPMYMRQITIFVALVAFCSTTACNNKTVDGAADFEFKSADNETNEINLTVTVRYRIKSRLEKKFENEYGRHYKDSLLLPVISTISKGVLGGYSAGEIYNYQRDSIEQKFKRQTKTTLEKYDIELTEFFIRSIGLSDTLMRKLEREHIERLSKEKGDGKN